MENLIYKLMPKIMADIGAIGKEQKNTMQGYMFRGIDDFVNALYPALIKHEVFICPRLKDSRDEIREVVRSNGKHGLDKYVHLEMEYDFIATDGSKITIGPIPSEGIDSSDKATNKALSAALKYALIQTFSVATQDMAEADKESPQIAPIAPKQSEQKYNMSSTYPKDVYGICIHCDGWLHLSKSGKSLYCENFRDGKEHMKIEYIGQPKLPSSIRSGLNEKQKAREFFESNRVVDNGDIDV